MSQQSQRENQTCLPHEPIAGSVTVDDVVGTVVGALGHFVVQLPGLRQKEAKYTAVFSLRDPGVKQVLKLMSPRVLGLSFSEINKFLIILLTDPMVTGSLPALNTAFKLIILPQGIIGQALGIAAFPTLSSLAARGERTEMRQIFADSLRILLFLGLPFSILFAVLGQPIVSFLFEPEDGDRFEVTALGRYCRVSFILFNSCHHVVLDTKAHLSELEQKRSLGGFAGAALGDIRDLVVRDDLCKGHGVVGPELSVVLLLPVLFE